MEIAKFEQKFLVVPLKYIAALSTEQKIKFNETMKALEEIVEKKGKAPLKDRYYMVCSMGEPYADIVKGTILFGESVKKSFLNASKSRTYLMQEIDRVEHGGE